MAEFLLPGLIFLFAGFIQGMTGFGAGLVAMPLLCLIMEVKSAVSLCILNGLIVTITLAIELRHLFDWRKILPLLAGSIPGVWLGTVLLKQADQLMVKNLLGIVLVAYSGFNLIFQPKPIRMRTGWGYLAGFSSGTITAMVSEGGPPVSIYTMLMGWNKEVIRATLTGFFVTNGAITAAVHAANGFIPATLLHVCAVTFPFVWAGSVLGSHVSRRINQRLFLQTVYLLLIGIGIIMIAAS